MPADIRFPIPPMLETAQGEIPAYWWHHAPNFGDLITPWLIEKMTGKKAVLRGKGEAHYVAVGSILAYVTQNSIVWGTGSFGIEQINQIQPKATYLAVRGPLTRNKIRTQKIECPAVYGDPALLTPEYFWPAVTPEYELGLILRHSEGTLNEQVQIDGVKKIYLRNDDVEGTIREILQCKRIATTSLHGLILADAYRIPSAWIDSKSPYGLDFKYWDYFLSVDKVRPPQPSTFAKENWSLGKSLNELEFDGRDIKLKLGPLRDCCPWM
jgi:pyruvyltransferase